MRKLLEKKRGGLYLSLLIFLLTSKSFALLASEPLPAEPIIPESKLNENVISTLIFTPQQKAAIELPAELQELPEATFKGFDAMLHMQTGLPYDVIRSDTLELVDPKVSGTEMGLRLLGIVAERDLGVISAEQAEDELEKVLSSLEKMEKAEVSRVINGEEVRAKFFYTFSDSRTLKAGLYGGKPEVGFFDNGNLAVALAITTQAFKGTDVARRAGALLDDMDFRFFLGPDGKSFRLGYYTDSETFTPWSLAQWGSEGILSVFLAVFKDGIDKQAFSDLLKLSPPRKYVTQEGEVIRTIPGYAGNMYVKLFPLLFFGIENNHPAILEDARRYVKVHIEEAKKQGLPIWGWASSSTVDGRYSEFGVREIAQFGNPSIKEVSPHASFLVLGALTGYEQADEELQAVMDNFLAMKKLNPEAYNTSRGFVDVIDPRSGEVGPHLIALDKGMEAVSIYNFLMRQRGQAGIEKYFWSYLEDLGKAGQARDLLQAVGEQMAEMLAVEAEALPSLEELDLTPLKGRVVSWAKGAEVELSSYNDPEEGEVIRVDYDVSRPGTYGGISIFPEGLSAPIKEYDYLVIKVRGLPESEGGNGFTDIFKLEVKPVADEYPFPWYDIRGVKEGWRTYFIKIPDDLSALEPEVDLNKALGELAVVFEDWKASDKTGTILISEIYLAKKKDSQGPPEAQPPTTLSQQERQNIMGTTAVQTVQNWAGEEEIRRAGVRIDMDKLIEDLAEIEPLVKEGREPLIEQLAEALRRQDINIEVAEVSKQDFGLENFFEEEQKLPFLLYLDKENPLGDKGFITVVNVYNALNPDLDTTPWREEDIIDYYNSQGEFRKFVGDQDYRPYWDGKVLFLRTEKQAGADLKILDKASGIGSFNDAPRGYAFESWAEDPERGSVLRLEYDVSDGARWAGLYVKLPDLNISGYRKFNLGIKAGSEGVPGRIKVELKKSGRIVWSTLISHISQEWRDFSIAMPSKLGRIDEVTIVFSYNMGGDLSGVVYIDPASFGFSR